VKLTNRTCNGFRTGKAQRFCRSNSNIVVKIYIPDIGGEFSLIKRQTLNKRLAFNISSGHTYDRSLNSQKPRKSERPVSAFNTSSEIGEVAT